MLLGNHLESPGSVRSHRIPCPQMPTVIRAVCLPGTSVSPVSQGRPHPHSTRGQFGLHLPPKKGIWFPRKPSGEPSSSHLNCTPGWALCFPLCFSTAHLNCSAPAARETPPQEQKFREKSPLPNNNPEFTACLALEETHQNPYVTLIDVGTLQSAAPGDTSPDVAHFDGGDDSRLGPAAS